MLSGQLYFRSDDRNPSEIFAKGFIPRWNITDYYRHMWGHPFSPDTYPPGSVLQKTAQAYHTKDYPALKNYWWFYAVNGHQSNRMGLESSIDIKNQLADAVTTLCTCLSFKFESAAYFPISQEITHTHIYLIALPQPTKLKHQKTKKAFRVPEDLTIIDAQSGKTPADPKQIVIDLHHLQTLQLGNCIRKKREEKKFDTNEIEIAWPLFAYEALAYIVPPANIMAAIPIKRIPPEQYTTTTASPSLKKFELVDRKEFEILAPPLWNPHFLPNQKILLCGEIEPRNISYSHLMPELKKMFSQLNRVERIPTIYWGLGGKIIANPIEDKIVPTSIVSVINPRYFEPESHRLFWLYSILEKSEPPFQFYKLLMENLFSFLNKCDAREPYLVQIVNQLAIHLKHNSLYRKDIHLQICFDDMKKQADSVIKISEMALKIMERLVKPIVINALPLTIRTVELIPIIYGYIVEPLKYIAPEPIPLSSYKWRHLQIELEREIKPNEMALANSQFWRSKRLPTQTPPKSTWELLRF